MDNFSSPLLYFGISLLRMAVVRPGRASPATGGSTVAVLVPVGGCWRSAPAGRLWDWDDAVVRNRQQNLGKIPGDMFDIDEDNVVTVLAVSQK